MIVGKNYIYTAAKLEHGMSGHAFFYPTHVKTVCRKYHNDETIKTNI